MINCGVSNVVKNSNNLYIDNSKNFNYAHDDISPRNFIELYEKYEESLINQGLVMLLDELTNKIQISDLEKLLEKSEEYNLQKLKSRYESNGATLIYSVDPETKKTRGIYIFAQYTILHDNGCYGTTKTLEFLANSNKKFEDYPLDILVKWTKLGMILERKTNLSIYIPTIDEKIINYWKDLAEKY